MNVIGTGMIVWHESRYLPLVIEQMQRTPGPRIIYHFDQPLMWMAYGDPPSGWSSKVSDMLGAANAIQVIRVRSPAGNTEVDIRNIITRRLRDQGATQCLWFDSDFIYDLPEYDEYIDRMCRNEPSCWSVKGQNLWRNWSTLYSRGN